MPLTHNAKLAGVALAGIVVAGALTANQYTQQQQLSQLKSSVYTPRVETVVVTATPEPTATPAAYLKYMKPVVKPVPVVSPVK